MFKVLAIIVTRNFKDCLETLRSLQSQTLKPDITVAVGKPCPGLVTGEIVGQTMNDALSKINLEDYDFLLKSDDDILFPPRFLEVNTQSKFDAMGRGAGLLIRMDPFVKYVKEWDTSSLEDTIPFWALMINGCEVLTSEWVLPAVLSKPSTEPFDFKRMWASGRDCYRAGFPFTVYVYRQLIHAKRNKELKAKVTQIWAIFGFMYGFFSRAKKLSIAQQYHDYMIKNRNRRLKNAVLSIMQ